MHWIASEGPDCWRGTAAGMAWALFTRHYHDGSLEVHADPEAHELERRAYYSGRFEFWRKGEVHGPIYDLDCNSLYSYCLHSGTYPISLVRVDQGDPSYLASLLADGVPCVAEVLAESGLYQWPSKVQGLTRYASGRYWSVLPGPEIGHLAKIGKILDVGRIAVYRPGQPFRSFTEHFYSTKLDGKASGNEMQAGMSKLVCNSLSGKFAQRSFEWVEREDIWPHISYGGWHGTDPQTNEIREYRAVASCVQERADWAEHPDSMPAIAAFCTSYGRLHHAKMVNSIGQAGVYFQNTDAIHTDRLGYNALKRGGHLSETAMGKLRLIDVADWAEYWAINDYQIGDRIVCPGVCLAEPRLSNLAVAVERGQGLPIVLSNEPEAKVVRHIVELRRSSCDLGGRKILDGVIQPLAVFDNLPRWENWTRYRGRARLGKQMLNTGEVPTAD